MPTTNAFVLYCIARAYSREIVHKKVSSERITTLPKKEPESEGVNTLVKNTKRLFGRCMVARFVYAYIVRIE